MIFIPCTMLTVMPVRIGGVGNRIAVVRRLEKIILKVAQSFVGWVCERVHTIRQGSLQSG